MPFQLVKQLEEERGDLHRVIPPLVNEHGQIEAGRRLGVSGSTISKWLRRNGYTRRVMWVRESEGKAS